MRIRSPRRPWSGAGASETSGSRASGSSTTKTADLLASAQSGGDRVWYTGDLISNTGPEDTNFVPRMVLTLFGGGGGYRLNRVPAMVYLNDKAAWRRAVGARLRDEPPTTVLPAHGAPVTLDAAQRTNALFGL